MATKKQVPASEGSARIRFIMLEADVPNGNLSEFAHTIANALKSSSYQRALAPGNGHKEPTTSESVDTTIEGADETADVEATAPSSTIVSAPKAPKSKKYISKPKVLDVDLTSGPKPLKEFLTEKSPESYNAKYLAVAAWFKEYRQIDTIGVDHVFTCFKSMGWGFGAMADLNGPLRELKRQSKGDIQDGKFTINHIGVGSVENMKTGD